MLQPHRAISECDDVLSLFVAYRLQICPSDDQTYLRPARNADMARRWNEHKPEHDLTTHLRGGRIGNPPD